MTRSKRALVKYTRRVRRTKVGGEVDLLAEGEGRLSLAGDASLPHLVEEGHLGTSEPVDGLLGVAHDEEGAGVVPVLQLPAFGEGAQEAHLEGVHVLRLVHEEVPQVLVKEDEALAGEPSALPRARRAPSSSSR